MMKKNIMKIICCITVDILIAASLIFCTYYVVYELPDITAVHADGNNLSHNGEHAFLKNSAAAGATVQPNLKKHFSNKFNGNSKLTKNSYISKDVAVQVDEHSLGSGSDKITYYTADIYVASMDSFKTAFGQDTYGTGYTEHMKKMSRRLHSIVALNGDSYCYNQKHLSGLLVRNKKIYREEDTASDMCVLFADGQMKTYEAGSFDPAKALKKGILQTWNFGPALLDKNGKAKTDFNTWGYIKQRHPRTAIGYYEPGHYCFLAVDGRQTGYSRGMTLEEMSKLFENMGCTAAYNLDGGHMTFMSFGKNLVNHSYKPDKRITDCLYICEPKQKKGA